MACATATMRAGADGRARLAGPPRLAAPGARLVELTSRGNGACSARRWLPPWRLTRRRRPVARRPLARTTTTRRCLPRMRTMAAWVSKRTMAAWVGWASTRLPLLRTTPSASSSSPRARSAQTRAAVLPSVGCWRRAAYGDSSLTRCTLSSPPLWPPTTTRWPPLGRRWSCSARSSCVQATRAPRSSVSLQRCRQPARAPSSALLA